MKDITRIHIAKVPYSIELSAKKELENYISALEAYSADEELLMDIEIRMTELLLERNVKQEDVISSDDVAAIREQLGEPKVFMPDELTNDVDDKTPSTDTVRKLYRNIDAAILGGVASGIASYLRISVLWVRLACIILTFVSAGFFIPLYVIAWLVIPPARTVAEKLQMAGQPVTLSSIREMNELGSTANTERRTAIIKRILTTVLGVTATGVAIGSAAALTTVAATIQSGEYAERIAAYQVPLILMFVSGLLLIVLSLLIAVASFAQKFSKGIWVSGLIIIVLGMITAGTMFSVVVVQQQSEREAIQRNTVEVIEKLPGSFGSARSLVVDMADATSLNYVVDTSAPTVKQRMLKGSPKVKVAVENGVAKISLEASKDRPWGADASVTVYGPAIENITVINGYVSYDGGVQAKLNVEVHNASMFALAESRIDTVNAIIDESGQFTGDSASISAINLVLSGRPSVALGNIKTLGVKSPDACATDAKATLNVQNILSATYEYNGIQTVSRSMQDPCFEITIASEDMQSYEYQN